MDLFLRKLITQNKKDLINKTLNLEKILQHLKSVNILNDFHERLIMTAPDRVERLYTIIMKRGPYAYEELYKALKVSNNDEALKILPDLLHVKKSNGIVNRNTSNYYSMECLPRGVALIINIYEYEYDANERRDGSLLDEQRMDHLWSELGFETRLHRNLTRDGLLLEVKRLSRVEYGDACVIVVMTHGSYEKRGGAKLICHDNQVVDSIEDIQVFFTSGNCYFASKPKIFIFQACRGKQKCFTPYSDATPSNEIVEDLSPPPVTNTYKNLLIAYSSPPGFVSSRDPDLGALFISTLYDVFCKHSYDLHVMKLFRKVGQKVEDFNSESVNGNQVVHLEQYQFSKKLFFNPVYHDLSVSVNGNSDLDLFIIPREEDSEMSQEHDRPSN